MRNGKHLMIDAYGCDREALWDVNIIRLMLLQVTKKIKLRPLSEDMIFCVDETMTHKSETGITGGIIFMESHFTFHSFPERNYFSADIYSCKGFKHLKVIEYITELFSAQEYDLTIIKRGKKL